MRNLPDLQKPTKTVKEKREGGKDEEEPSLLTISYGNPGQSIRLNMNANYRRRTKFTSPQAKALVLDRVQNAEGTKGSSTIDTGTIIKFRTEKY